MSVKVEFEENSPEKGKKGELADKPGSVVSNHSSGIHVTVQLKQPTQKPCGPHVSIRNVSLFGLAPGGVFPATYVAISAVRSYRTISPLPMHKMQRRYIFCGTFRRLAPPRRYLAPCPVEPGLSSGI